MPLPATDFDPTESAVPWRVLTSAGHELVFATPTGERAHCDERMLSGRGLGPWRPILAARSDARQAYRELEQAASFRAPLAHAHLADASFDAVVLPGGHAPGMRPYLESPGLQAAVARHFGAGRPLAAICHGVVLAARSQGAAGRSILHGRHTTALTEPMELSAWSMTRLWLGDYYRTYPETVEREVTRAVGPDGRFSRGPFAVLRDSPARLGRGFTVRDGHYLSARWPGDAYAFSRDLVAMLRAGGRG